MRIPKMLTALSTTIMAGSARVAMAQDPVKVELTTTESHTIWYTDPMWLAIGGVVFLVIIVLAIMASMNGRKTTTTVIR